MEVGLLGLDESPGTPMRVRSGIAALVEIGAPLVAGLGSGRGKILAKEGKGHAVFHGPSRLFR